MWKSALAAIALYRESLGICPGVSVQNMLGTGARGKDLCRVRGALTLHHLIVVRLLRDGPGWVRSA
jgi:hypothetical protein